jgi:hypothetical protein
MALIVTCAGSSDAFQVTVSLVSPPGNTGVLHGTVTPAQLPYQFSFGTSGQPQTLTVRTNESPRQIPLSVSVQPGLFAAAGDYTEAFKFRISYAPASASTSPAANRIEVVHSKRATPKIFSRIGERRSR